MMAARQRVNPTLAIPLNRRTLQRVALMVITAISIIATLWLLRADEHARVQMRDTTMTREWQSTTSSIAPRNTNDAMASLNAVVSQWSMRRESNAEQTTLTWTVADTRDLQASLLALDSAAVRTQRIDVKKRESGFAVRAEFSL
jgi:hypothetical protein